MRQWPIPFEGLLFHYTSAATAVESILATGQLRLGMFEFTNDPRESAEWGISASLPEGVDLPNDEFFALVKAADHALRRSVKLACFTEDSPPRSDLDEISGRGFGHSSMWAHYAGGHTGVCLGFDRTALLTAMKEQLGDRQDAYFDGPVEYVADPTPPLEVTSFRVDQVDEYGLDALAIARVQKYWRELFFRKDPDWAVEREYRCVVLTPDPAPLFVDVSGCVKAVILGNSFAAARVPAVHHAAGSLGGVEIVRIHYRNGQPSLLPALPEKAEFDRPHRRSGDVLARARALAEDEH